MRRILLLAVALLMGACGVPSYDMHVDPGFGLDYELKHEWSAGVPIEEGFPTSCFATHAYGGVESWQCRSVHGYDELGGKHDENYTLTHMTEGAVLSMEGSNTDQAGKTLVMWNGRIYEGCTASNTLVVPNYEEGGWAFCDYYTTMWTAPWPQSDVDGTEYVLRKTYQWFGYAGNALGCASAITGVLIYGKAWTAPGLADCAAGPL